MTGIRRRIERFVANPDCQANAVAAVHGISMAAVARREGLTVQEGISPFAFRRGFAFEAALFEDQARRLRDALVEEGVFPDLDARVIDLRPRELGGPIADAPSSARRFAEALRDPDPRPAILIGPALGLPDLSPLVGGLLIADLMLLREVDGARELSIGEIKSYPDLEGFTDSAQLASARAQAGLYHHAAQLLLDELAIPKLALADRGHLVLARPGLNANRPRLRAFEDLRWQSARAAQGLARLRQAAAETAAITDPRSEAALDAVSGCETRFSELCGSFCERAQPCREAALEAGDASALGDDLARALGPIPLTRARALLDGAAPANPSEAALLDQLARIPRFAV